MGSSQSKNKGKGQDKHFSADLTSMDAQFQAMLLQGKSDKALVLERKALEVSQATVGLEHPATLQRMFDLAQTLHGLQNFEDAEMVLRQLLPLREKILGLRHRATIETMANLVRELFYQHKYTEAIPVLQEQVRRCKEGFGDDHALTITALVHLGKAYKMYGALKQAHATLCAALPVVLKALDEASPHVQDLRKDIDDVQKEAAATLGLRQALAAKHDLRIPEW